MAEEKENTNPETGKPIPGPCLISSSPQSLELLFPRPQTANYQAAVVTATRLSSPFPPQKFSMLQK